MILLDTNIVSALMRPALDQAIETWMNRLVGETLATSAITVMEIRYGLERMPEGRRRSDLAARFETLIAPGEGLPVFPFNEETARVAAAFQARRQSQGRPTSVQDMMIAGIAATAGASLATRNSRDFENLGLDLIVPLAQ